MRRQIFLLATLLLGLIVGVAFGELALRLFGWQSRINFLSLESFRLSSDPRIGYELRPGALDRGEPISSAGLRDREFSLEKPAGVFRIAVVGDSVTFGLGLNREQAYPKVLEGFLNQGAKAPRFEVMNFAVSGYNIEQIVEICEQKIPPFSPDLILYGYCLNDPQNISLELLNLQVRQAQGQASLEDELSRGVRRWLRHSRLFLLAFELFQAPPDTAPLRTDESGLAGFQGSSFDYLDWLHTQPSGWERVTRGFRELSALAKTRQIPVVVTILPTQKIEDAGEYVFSELDARVLREAKAQGLQVMDLAPPFRAAQTVLEVKLFRDYLHLEPAGSLSVALAILDGLLELRLLPAREQSVKAWPLREELEQRIAAAIGDRN